MPIVIEAGSNVQRYIWFGLAQAGERPGGCVQCGAVGQMVGHGYYRRKPKGVPPCWVIQIKRWKCKQCGKTVGAVPSCLLFYRHYVLEVIQEVLVGRSERGYSWSEMVDQCGAEGAPGRRTMQRWCEGLDQQAPGWLGVIEKTLAEQNSGSEWLDVQGEVLRTGTAAQALLHASLHLLAWAKERWQEIASYGLNDRLRFLWFWGNRRAGQQRLI